MKQIKLINSNKVTLVDDKDYKIVSKFKWRLSGNGYVKHVFYYVDANGILKQKTIYLHRFIYSLHNSKIPKRLFVDHVDRNPLNNQLDNLRLATQRQNSRNNSTPVTNNSGYRNVSKRISKYTRKDGTIWEKAYWLAEINCDSKKYNKFFEYTEEGKVKAAEWVDMKRKELFGEFHGQLNF